MLKLSEKHVPDILDCIANLSSDEVFTPPDVAQSILDLLPQEIWSNPDIKILDPVCKTGVLLRECAGRLMVGLEKHFPDEVERREHIFKNMLHGIAITELTSLISRRSLYYSKDASSDNSVVKFDQPEGNIRFKRYEHTFTNGKCEVCGSPYKAVERGDSFENYAYQFIHEKVDSNMKFDVVIGNPPYQMTDGGGGGKGSSASPIYQLFVNQAFRLKPRYVAMIIPSRWFSGGKGLDSFRSQMLKSKNFQELVYYPDSAEVFPGPDFGGGVCYFLWDEKYEGKCTFKTVTSGVVTNTTERFLDEDGEVLISHAEARPIVKKIQAKGLPTFDELVSSRRPFGISVKPAMSKDKPFKDSVELLTSDGICYIKRDDVITKSEWIDKYKVIIGKAYGERGAYPYKILAQPKVLAPGSACSETYLVCGVFKTKKEADLVASYIETRFFRFLLALQKNTQNITKEKFSFIPMVDLSKPWTDEALFKEFGITKAEQEYIYSIVREMGQSD